MARIKQKVQAFQTATKEYNKRKVSLKNEFVSEMHKAIEESNWVYYDALKIDYKIYFPDIYEFTISSVENLHNMNRHETEIN